MDGSGVSLPIWRATSWSMETPASGLVLGPVGAWQVSHVASTMPCGSELSPGLLRMPETTVTYSRRLSSGLVILENWKSLPEPSGVQNFCTAPWGK